MNQKKILVFFQILIAVTFIFSAISKIISPGYFEITLLDQGLFSSREIASYFTRIFIIIELFIGLLFLQSNYLKKIIAPAVILLLVLFIIHMILLIILGDNENCGCFSSVIKMSPLSAILKNFVLLAIALFVHKYSYQKQNSIKVPSSLLVLSIIVVIIFSPIRSSDEFLFSKFTNFENGERVDLSESEIIIAVFDAECEHCLETAKSINRIDSEMENFPKFYILIFGESDKDINNFMTESDINYPYSKINIDDFFDLIGNVPPRLYWLKDGEIIEIWDESAEEKLWEKFGQKDNSYFELNVE